MINKVVVYSSLFPSRRQPVNGLFVAELVKALSADMRLGVVKPVPLIKNIQYYLSDSRIQMFAGQIEVRLPYFFNFPKVLKGTDGLLMALSTRRAFRKSVKENTDLVHAHFAYPDAVAAWILSSQLKLPLVVTVHGSDIHMHARDPKRKGLIVAMLQQADAIVCVSRDLLKKVLNLGISKKRVHHIPNGVDTSKFSLKNKSKCRQKLGLEHRKKVLLTVGNLIPVKAYDRLIKALPAMDPDVSLVMVGQGHGRSALEKQVKDLGLQKRVLFAGMVRHHDLGTYYNAADFLVICSHSEGWPTVLFEAFACGLPVLANGVGGIPEVISSSAYGLIMKDNHPQTIAETVLSAYGRNWDPEALIEAARKNSWHEIARQYRRLYERVLSEGRHNG